MNQTFMTSDFSLATTLVTLGFPVEKLDRSFSVRRVQFVFEKTPELDEVVEQYWHNTLQVEPKHFCLQQKCLKSQLYHTV